MPDVFQLQASVKIDTSDANQKLDDLITKAKELDGYLGGDHTVNPPKDGGGGGGGSGGGGDGGKENPPTTNTGGGDGPTVIPPNGSNADTTEKSPNAALQFLKNYWREILVGVVGATTLYTGILAGATAITGAMDEKVLSQLGTFEFSPEQQAAAMNWYENQFNSAPSTRAGDEGFTMADTAYFDFEEAVGEEMAAKFTEAMASFGFTDKEFSRQDVINQWGHDITELFANPVEIPSKPKVEDGAAEDISAQIGEVVVPATVQVTGVSGGFGDTVKSVGSTVLSEVAGAALGGLAEAVLGKRKKSVGMERIPTDNYVVALHQDESVLTKEEAAQWRKRNGNQEASAFDIANALRGVNVYLGPDQVGHLISGPVGANINSRQNYKLRSMGG